MKETTKYLLGLFALWLLTSMLFGKGIEDGGAAQDMMNSAFDLIEEAIQEE